MGPVLSLMKLSTVTFAKTIYSIADPLPTWFQQSAAVAPECSICDAQLVFTFPARTNPAVEGIAGYYQTPAGVRCDCFVVQDDPAVTNDSLSYHKRLNREPVPINPINHDPASCKSF